MITSKKKTYLVNPGALLDTDHIPKGKNHKWCIVVAILILVVSGQVRYLATPTGNLRTVIKLTMSRYQGIWSHVITTIAALITQEYPRIILVPTNSKHTLHAHNI